MREQSEPGATTRRQFLKHVGVIGGASAVALTTGVEIEAQEAPSTTTAVPVRNDTMRMVKDLDRALARPLDARRWGMVIDLRRCIGCHACTAACIAENRLPAGVSYRSVPEVESGTFPTLQRFFMPTNCMQCENAPCVAAANGVVSGAMGRRPDGIVTIDYTRMKGRAVFEAASKACPYSQALYFDEGRNWTDGTPALQPYELRPSREYGRAWSRAQTKGTTRKCHFCIERIEQGLLPACVATCTGQAMHFGDLADDESLVSERLRTTKTWRLENGASTSPRVFYVEELLEAVRPLNLEPPVSCRSCHE